MDEVDGMSAGDRGGVPDLIQTIKSAKLPIICICNDKYNQKLKSLRNSCLELDFRCGCMMACLCALKTLPNEGALFSNILKCSRRVKNLLI